MRHRVAIMMVHLLLCFVLTAPAHAGEPLPQLTLTVPEQKVYRQYLGLDHDPGETFAIGDIKADVLVIELFSMYCPYCQEEAPLVNELYGAMNNLPEDGPVVKILGLGASNTQYEVDYFRESFDIDFPLFPDTDMAMYKALAGDGTPTFIGVRILPEGNPSIILRQVGGFYDAEDFLHELLQKSGLQLEQ